MRRQTERTLSVLSVAGILVEAVLGLGLLVDEAVEARDDPVFSLVAILTIIHALLTVVLAVAHIVVLELHDTDLAVSTSSTATLLAPLQASKHVSPVEIDECYDHHCETAVDGDDHRPFREVLCWDGELNDLVVKFEVTDFAGVLVAVRHDPDLVCALER